MSFVNHNKPLKKQLSIKKKNENKTNINAKKISYKNNIHKLFIETPKTKNIKQPKPIIKLRTNKLK